MESNNEKQKRGVPVITVDPKIVVKKSESHIPHVVTPVIDFSSVPRDPSDKRPPMSDTQPTIESYSEEVIYYVDEDVNDDFADDHEEELGDDKRHYFESFRSHPCDYRDY